MPTGEITRGANGRRKVERVRRAEGKERAAIKREGSSGRREKEDGEIKVTFALAGKPSGTFDYGRAIPRRPSFLSFDSPQLVLLEAIECDAVRRVDFFFVRIIVRGLTPISELAKTTMIGGRGEGGGGPRCASGEG